MPLFSIVTVCYNSGSSIERTLKSVFAQQYIDYEYLIIDGGSTDATVDIIRSYESRFAGRMKWISEPDKGIYDAFNKGCRMAVGKYIWLVNSDDFIEPHALEKFAGYIAEIGEKRTPVISAAANFVSPDGKTVYWKMFFSDDTLAYTYKIDTIGIIHPASIVPKRVYEKVGYYDPEYKIIGDLDWFQRAYREGIFFYFFDEVVTNMADGGISSVNSYKKNAADRRRLLKKKYSNFVVRQARFLRWAFYYWVDVVLKLYRKRKNAKR